MREAALVEIIAELVRQLLGGERLRLVEAIRRERLAVVPPFDDGIEMLQFHRLRLGEMLVAVGHVHAVEPCLFCGAVVVEEEDVRRDGRVGGEDAAGHADDRVEVEFLQQLLLEIDFRVVGAEEEAVRQDDGGAAVLFETIHDDGHEKVRRFGTCEIGGEDVLDVRLFAAAVGGIHEHDVEAVVVGVVQDVLQQRVAVEDVGHVQIMEEHVRDAEHVGELLLLDAMDGIAEGRLVGGRLDLFLQFLQPTGEEAACAAGEIRHLLADLRADHLRHEFGHGSRRVEFAGGSRALQFLQNRLVDFAEGVALFVVAEIQFVDDVDDLPQKDAVLHIIVSV